MNAEFTSMCALYNFEGANDSIDQAAMSMSGGMSPASPRVGSKLKSNITRTGMSAEKSVDFRMTDSRESL